MKIEEDEVKDILKNYEKKLLLISDKMKSLYREIQSPDAAVSEAAFPCTKYGTLSRNSMHRDISDVLQRCEGIFMKRNEEVRELMYQLSEEQERIHRVWVCFNILEEPYFGILHGLYVQNKLYQEMEMESGYSHKTFEKYRSEGVNFIVLMFSSGGSVGDLTRLYRRMTRKKKHTKEAEPPRSGSGCRQMSLFEAFQDGNSQKNSSRQNGKDKG